MNIGIIGGGQLGMMMAESAIKQGHDVNALDHAWTAPIKGYSKNLFTDGFTHKAGYQKLYEISDVLTYEFENVSLNWVNHFVDKIPQKTKALEISRHRLIEKEFASSLNIKTPHYELFDQSHTYTYPFILKTTTLGYDGHGQYRINSKEDINKIKDIHSLELIKEEIIKFDDEISVVCTRDQFGNIAVFPIPRNIHKNGILHLSILDDKISEEVKQTATTYAKDIITALDYVGTLAVEFFVCGKEVLFNEFAPRPHNSGHYTIEGCNVSQFDNHILAVTGNEVITPNLLSKTVMLNILGQDLEITKKCESMDQVYVHMYHKKEAKHNRKMGHVTITGDDCLEKLALIIGETK